MAWHARPEDGRWDPAELLGRLEEVADPAFRLATVVLRDEAAAEEVVFRAALAAARRRPGREAPSFRAWFLALVAAETGHVRLRDLLPGGALPEEGLGEPELDAAARAEAWRALEGLGKGDRLALFCFFYLRLPMSEVATVLRTSVRGARRRIHRAVRRRAADATPGGGQDLAGIPGMVDRRSLRETFEAVTRPASPALLEQIQRALAESRSMSRRVLVARGAAIGLAGLVVFALVGIGVVYGHRGWTARPASPPAAAGGEPAAPELRLEPTPAPGTPTPSVAVTVSPSPTPAPSPTLTPPPTPVAPAPVPDLGFSCAPWSGGGGAAQLATVRAGAHPTYDRFVMQFDGPVPQYQVSLQGSTVTILLQETSSSGSYPLELRLGYAVLQAAWQRTAEGGRVEWQLQLARPECLHVFTLSAPSRLVVDVQHG